MNEPLDRETARGHQRALAASVELNDRLGAIDTVAGVDVAFRDRGALAQAGAAVLTYPGLEPIERVAVQLPARYPYIPGLLALRELEPVQAALERLTSMPDVILCDGQGIAHPRRCGIACHLGLALDRPTVGVAKTRLVGTHTTPGPERGADAPLEQAGDTVGAVLRTRACVRPVYVSPGHRVSLLTATALALACAPRYRLPEPLRAADRMSRVEADVITAL